MADFINSQRQWLSIDQTTESTFGTDPAGTPIGFDREEFEPIEPVAADDGYFLNNEEATASFYPTTASLFRLRCDVPITTRLNTELVGLVAAGMCDEYPAPTDLTGEYQHNFRWYASGLTSADGLAPFKSRTIHHLYADVAKKFTGVIFNELAITSERGQFAKCAVKGMGYSTYGASTKTEANMQTARGLMTCPYLKAANLVMQKGTYTRSSESFGSATTISTELVDFSFMIRKNAEEIAGHGDTGGAVTRFDPIGMEIEFSTKFQLETQADYFTDWTNQTAIDLKVAITGATITDNPWTINIIVPDCVIAENKISAENGKLYRSVKWQPLANVVGADDQSEVVDIQVISTNSSFTS